MLEAIFHGHSFVEIASSEKGSIFVDPFIAGNAQCKLSLDEAIKKHPLSIVVTHGHVDHIGDTIKIAKSTGCLVIATYELIERFKTQGLENLSAQHIGGEVFYKILESERKIEGNEGKNQYGYSIKLTTALHGGGIIGTKMTALASGVIIRIDNKHIYHAGDTGLSQEMKLLGEYEKIDLAFLPIGDRFTMGIKDAVIAVGFIKAKIVVPIHYNTWKEIMTNPIEFAREVMLRGVSIPKVLKPLQRVVL